MPRSLCRAPAYAGVLPGQVPVFAPSDKETGVQRGSNLTQTYTARGGCESFSRCGRAGRGGGRTWVWFPHSSRLEDTDRLRTGTVTFGPLVGVYTFLTLTLIAVLRSNFSVVYRSPASPRRTAAIGKVPRPWICYVCEPPNKVRPSMGWAPKFLLATADA